MYRSPWAFRRTAREYADQLLSWQRPDHAFFAAGACHILAYAFLDLHPRAGFRLVGLWPDGEPHPHHSYVTDGVWAFDFDGWTPQAELLAVVGPGHEPRPVDLDLPAFCARYNHRMRHQFAFDPWDRAQRYVADHVEPWPAR